MKRGTPTRLNYSDFENSDDTSSNYSNDSDDSDDSNHLDNSFDKQRYSPKHTNTAEEISFTTPYFAYPIITPMKTEDKNREKILTKYNTDVENIKKKNDYSTITINNRQLMNILYCFVVNANGDKFIQLYSQFEMYFKGIRDYDTIHHTENFKKLLANFTSFFNKLGDNKLLTVYRNCTSCKVPKCTNCSLINSNEYNYENINFFLTSFYRTISKN